MHTGESGDLPTLETGQLQPGDLVFGRKKSAMQWLLDQVGDPWRHVAIVSDVVGRVAYVGEITGAHRVGARTVAAMLKFYDEVGVARLSPDHADCIDRALDWVVDRVETPQLYAWDDVLLTGLAMLTRKLGRVDMDRLARTLEEVAAYHPPPRGPSMTCSAFIYEAFRQAGDDCVLDIDLSNLGATPQGGTRSEPQIAAFLESAENVPTALDEFSLWELHHFDREIDFFNTRGHSKSRMSMAQAVKAAALMAKAVEQYSSDYPVSGKGSPSDGRWVTPGDLWRSSNVIERFYLSPENS